MKVTRITTALLATAAGLLLLVGCGTDKYANDPAFTRIAGSSSCSQLSTYRSMARSSGTNGASEDPSLGARVRFNDMAQRATDRMAELNCY